MSVIVSYLEEQDRRKAFWLHLSYVQALIVHATIEHPSNPQIPHQDVSRQSQAVNQTGPCAIFHRSRVYLMPRVRQRLPDTVGDVGLPGPTRYEHQPRLATTHRRRAIFPVASFIISRPQHLSHVCGCLTTRVAMCRP